MSLVSVPKVTTDKRLKLIWFDSWKFMKTVISRHALIEMIIGLTGLSVKESKIQSIISVVSQIKKPSKKIQIKRLLEITCISTHYGESKLSYDKICEGGNSIWPPRKFLVPRYRWKYGVWVKFRNEGIHEPESVFKAKFRSVLTWFSFAYFFTRIRNSPVFNDQEVPEM